MEFPPVAVVGQSCLLPGANDPAQLWRAVLAGEDLLRPAPFGRWRIDKTRVLASHVGGERDSALSDRGGYLEGFERLFDAGGFALPAETLLALDPLFQWTLHAAREALRDASHDGAGGPRVGLILGNLSFPSAALSRYAEAVWLGERAPHAAPQPLNRFMSGLPAHLAAQALGLGGVAFALDAACASSLYALKLACDRLHDGSADVMLAGAVNAADDLFLHVGFTALKALSPSGRSRPFHREADGLLPAEGVAFVVLKRLDDAVRARDRILGVIRGIGLSNDGRGAGLLAPAEEGQRRALAGAYAVSGLLPRDVSLLECHATGTAVGDLTEVKSTAALFQGSHDVPIGSLKSNLGHLITVAGMAGLLKVLAAMAAGVRPPTLHADDPLPALAASPFRLLREPEPWESAAPRRAGVSAFGFGGNNAHAIVEEWRGERPDLVAVPVRQPPADAIAVVGLGLVAADAADAPGFARALFLGETRIRRGPDGRSSGCCESVELEASVRFPPRDLEQTLPQQLLLLRAAQEAVAQAGALPSERTSVLVGMQCDTEVARFGARWRLGEWAAGALRGELAAAESLGAARDAFAPPLTPAGVVGCMPNICANRLNSQFDARGPSLSVAAEELSGLVALDLASRALRRGEIDAALVGAVDVCSGEAHARAAVSVLEADRHTPGDAAVVLVVKRLADARRDGNEILALLPEGDADLLEIDDSAPRRLFGHAHAASGLLGLAALMLGLRHRAEPAPPGGLAEPRLPATRADERELRLTGLGGARARVRVRAADPVPLLLEAPPRVHVFSGESRADLRAALRERRESRQGPVRLALIAATDAELSEQAARAETLLEAAPGAVVQDGLALFDAPIEGELAFVFAAPAGSYRDMGRELTLAAPQLVDAFVSRWSRLRETASWIYDGESGEPGSAQKLWGSSYLCQLHAELTRRVLRLAPQAAIGVSSGETNALYALGAWDDIDGIVADIEAAGVYNQELAGRFDAVRRYHGLPQGAAVSWASHRVLAPLEELRAALENEPLAHLAIVNAPGDAVVTGDGEACARVLARVGRERSRPLGYDMAVHCPELSAFADGWRRIHHRKTRPLPGVRFYTHATCDHYPLSDEAVADALLAQAGSTVDFPRLVLKAWQDGVRVFLEHGPQGGCSRWISRILGDRPHLALPLDARGVSSLRQAANAAAGLAAAGVAVDLDAFHEAFRERQAQAPAARMLEFAVARKAPRLPAATVEVMQPAPALPSLLEPPDPIRPAVATALMAFAEAAAFATPAQEPAAVEMPRTGSAVLDRIVAEQTRVTGLHQAFLARQAEIHRQFLALRMGAQPAATTALLEPPPPLSSAPPPLTERRAFSRRDLETHASGRISSLFGPLFEPQDGFLRQVRMPEPPLLLADRVTGLEGEPGSMGLGTVWTETDVAEDAFYLHAGRMPAGILIESGQADLFLISWLGVDLRNRGERVYRLLGCELTYHGSLPVPGETLRYEIHVDGHARQGEIGLFFFHYDCQAGGERRLSVRQGQAGFFTDDELRASGGVLWDPESAEPAASRLDGSVAGVVPARSFSLEAVRAFSEGRVADCFGASHALAETHVETPRIAGGGMLLIGEVEELDPSGGPWRRGYLRSVRTLSADDWFYAGHFKNDPCMPGTLMFEGCLQAMAFYLAALGHTLDKDGWRFEPVPDLPYSLRCRGQATPSSRELVYELFVSELHDSPEPTLFADLLCTVDGVKAFHCRRMGLRLVPDTPMARRPERSLGPAPSARAATTAGLRLDFPAMLACAWGQPSKALGPAYAVFDGARRMPRLPGPPYHFLSRVTRLSSEIGALGPGAEIEVEYDVPEDAWYFRENAAATMPFCVLLEANLQPCGWLALATGIPLASDSSLYFRNLDGTSTLRRALSRQTGTLRTLVRLLDVSRSSGMSLLSFDVRSFAGDEPVFEMSTGFGFFPKDALAQQLGLPTSESDRAWLRRESERHVDLSALRAASPALPGPRLLMLDRITGHWPNAGGAGLGRWRAEKDVRPAEWFFKAHFHRDPVQPGSLGLQALLQLVQCAMLERGMAEGLRRPAFEPIALGKALSWKYRGQVVPANQVLTLEVELLEMGADERGRCAVANGWLWVDGVRIYAAAGLAMRIVEADA